MGVNLGSLGDLGDIGKQFLVWQVLGQIAQAVLGPVLVEIQQDVSGRINRVALSPADVVEAVIKGHMTAEAGSAEAALSGLDGERFRFLVDSAGEPPGLEQLLEWARREIIPWAGRGADAVSLEQGVLDSRVKDKWLGPIEAAKTVPLSPGEAVAAAVRGNLSLEQAAHLAYYSGVSAEDFGTMVHNAGNPPSPGELLELLRRDLIPLAGTGPDVTSFQQGIFEGDTKDKWWELFAKLGDYIPPPRTVTALLREGAIPEAQGLQLLKWAGLSDELAQAYVNAASKGSAAQTKELTKSEVLQLYAAGVIGKAAAGADLAKLGLKADEVSELLALQDSKRERQLVQQVITRIRTLFVGHKITEAQASQALTELGQDQAEVTHELTLWQLERAVPTQHLTAAELTNAVQHSILTPEQGLAGLESLGYTAWEAWLAITVRLHGLQPTFPEPADSRPAWAG